MLGICALSLTHPKCTHTQLWTHTPWTQTRSSGQAFMLRHPGSSWGPVPCSRAPQSWYRGWRVRCAFTTPPHLQFLPARDSNSQPFDYESNSLTIRPRIAYMCASHVFNVSTAHEHRWSQWDDAIAQSHENEVECDAPLLIEMLTSPPQRPVQPLNAWL